MVFIILYKTNNLSDPLFWGLLFVAVFALLWYYNSPKMINFNEARELALYTTLEEQRQGHIEDGTVRLMPETELKKVLLKDSKQEAIEPDYWEIGVIVDGNETLGYVVSISIWGEVESMTEINLPSTYHVTQKPRIKIFQAKKIAKKSELQEKARKNVEEVTEDED